MFDDLSFSDASFDPQAFGFSAAPVPAAEPQGPWRKLSPEPPRPRRRPEPAAAPRRPAPIAEPPIALPAAPIAPIAKVVPLPGLRVVVDRDSPFRDLILGEIVQRETSAGPVSRPADDEELAIALLLAA